MKLNNNVFIAGISFVPGFVTGFTGGFDAKRNAVQLYDDEWHGHFIDNKVETLTKYINTIYTTLEKFVKPLYVRSGELVTRVDILKDVIEDCEAVINNGFTDRLSERRVKLATRKLAESTDELRSCITELSNIESQIVSFLVLAKGKEAKAISVCGKHIQRYLLGASRKVNKVEHNTTYDVVSHVGFTVEARFIDAHHRADIERRNIIAQRHPVV